MMFSCNNCKAVPRRYKLICAVLVTCTFTYGLILKSQGPLTYEVENSVPVSEDTGILHRTSTALPLPTADPYLEYQPGENDTDDVLYGMGLSEEIRQALKGGPLDYLSEYESPCWLSKYDSRQAYSSKSMLRGHTAPLAQSHMRGMTVSRATDRLRCLPAVYLIGAPGSGTTDLCRNLIKHSKGRIPEPITKEPMFWCNRHHDRDAISKYIDLFDPNAAMMRKKQAVNGTHHGLILDASTQYLFKDPFWRNLPANHGLTEPRYNLAHMLKSLYNKTKIILMLREPADRVYSQYKTNLSYGLKRATPEQFHEHIKTLIRMFEECFTSRGIRECLYDVGADAPIRAKELASGVVLRASLYYQYVRDWMKVFGQKNMLIIKSEDYYKNQADSLADIYTFLGIDQGDLTIDKGKRSNSHKSRDMLPQTRDLLNDFIRPHNEKLVNYLKSDAFYWNVSNII